MNDFDKEYADYILRKNHDAEPRVLPPLPSEAETRQLLHSIYEKHEPRRVQRSPYYQSWRKYPVSIGIDLLLRFILALLGTTFLGLIGWLGLILAALRFFSVILWPWWVAALPLEYLVLYCLYMTIDGAICRTTGKDVGRYAQFTSGVDKRGNPVNAISRWQASIFR